jgi:GAF domain-containing protein
MTTDPFTEASRDLENASTRVSDLAHPFVRLLPVSGASVSTFGPLLGAETLSATDERAVRVDELQFDLGQGPCWDALTTRRPVIEPDLSRTTSWPQFSRALDRQNIRSLFAFPLTFGPLDLGAIDLYSLDPVQLSQQQQEQTVALSAVVSRIVLRHAVDQSAVTERVAPFSRRVIHQATGMVLAQLDITAEDAYLLIQARAFADGRPMQDVAQDIVKRQLRFTRDTDTAEGSP